MSPSDSFQVCVNQGLSSEREFTSLANSLREQGYTHVPIVRETLADLDTPVSTYLKLANKSYTYLFESVQGGSKWGRYSIIGLPCNDIYRFFGHVMSHERDGQIISETTVDDPLESVRQLQAQFNVATFDGLPEMTGGLVGYFGYETIGFVESRLAFKDKPDAIGAPDIMLMVSKDVLVFDNLSGRIFMVTLADLNDENAYATAQRH